MVKIRTGESVEQMGWRLIRIRKALKAFKEFGYTTFKNDDWYIEDDKPRIENSEGKKLPKKDPAILQTKDHSWAGVTGAIANVANTGWDEEEIDNISERIRQFVEGTDWLEGTGEDAIVIGTNYPVPRKDRMAAIEKFLTYHDPEDPDHIEPLFATEYLTVYSPELQAPLHLQEFLNDGAGGSCYFTPDQVDGQYIAIQETDSGVSRFCLNMQMGESDGLLKTQLVKEVFQSDEISDDRSRLFDLENTQSSQNPVAYFGWGVTTPEDNIYLFFNNLVSEENHFVFTLAMDEGIYDEIEAPIQRFVVINHNLPFPISVPYVTDNMLMDDVFQKTKNNLMVFHRA